MKYSLVLSAVFALTVSQAQAAVMNFNVTPFSANYAQFERVVSSSAQGIISIDSIEAKPSAISYQLTFGQLNKMTDSGIQSFGFGGNTFLSRTATYGGIVQQGEQGLQFICSYIAFTETDCAFNHFDSFLELNLKQTQYEDGTISNSVTAALRYQASKTDTGAQEGQTNTTTYRRNFMFNDWTMQDWNVQLPSSKDLLNWLSGSAKVSHVTEQLVLTSAICSEDSCSTNSTLYNLMVPGSTNWQIEEINLSSSASFVLLGLAGLLVRRRTRVQ